MSQPNQPRWPELRSLQPGVIPLGPLSMREIFSGALETMRRHAALLFGTALVVVGVTRLLVHWVTAPMLLDLPRLGPRPTQTQLNDYIVQLMPISGVDTALSMLALVFVSGIGTVAVGRAVLGQPLTLREAAEDLRPLLLPLLGVTVLVSVAVAVGLLALVAPGIWLAVLLSLAAPAIVLERSGVKQSLVRSRDLVRDNWWRIFAIVAVAFVIVLGVNALAGMVTGAVRPTDGVLSLPMIGSIIAGTLTAPFFAVVTALIYVDRRFHTDDLALDLARAAGLK